MNSWTAIDMIWLIAVLVAVVSALSVRKMSFGFVARSLAAWAVIGLVAYVAVAHRYEIKAMFGHVTATLGLDDQQVQGKTIRIRMSPDGHFWARVSLNGFERRMLIDSGATFTAISAKTAQAADIDTSGGVPAMIETANGTVTARRGRIRELAIGPLKTDDLGVVVSDSFGDLDVIGMNFLSRLRSWRVEGNVLVLDPGDRTAGGSDEAEEAEIAPDAT